MDLCCGLNCFPGNFSPNNARREVRRILAMLYQSVVENDPWSHELMGKHQDLLNTDITIDMTTARLKRCLDEARGEKCDSLSAMQLGRKWVDRQILTLVKTHVDEGPIYTTSTCVCGELYETHPMIPSLGHDYANAVNVEYENINATSSELLFAQGLDMESQIRTGQCQCTGSLSTVSSKRLVHAAVASGHLDQLKLLAEFGCDLNDRTAKRKLTPLILAIQSNRLDIVEYLLSNGVSVSVNIHSLTSLPLVTAIRLGNEAIVKMLLSNPNVDVNGRDKSEMFTVTTPLVTAIKYNRIRIAKELIKHGAQVNMEDLPPLSAAIHSDNLEMVNLLLDFGAYPDYCADPLLSPLRKSMYMHSHGILEALIKHGADIHRRDNAGCTALHVAVCNRDVTSVKILIKHGAKTNIADYRGATPLSVAAINNARDIADILVRNGADINIADEFEATALHHAAFRGNDDMVALLLKSGGNPNSRCCYDTGVSPLWCAIYGGNVGIAKALIDSGADMDILTVGRNYDIMYNYGYHSLYPHPVYRERKSLLWVAIQRGFTDAAFHLIDSGYKTIHDEWLFTRNFPNTRYDMTKVCKTMVHYLKPPTTLLEHCRKALRKHHGAKLREMATRSEIPSILKDYLTLNLPSVH